jgi:transcriptional regulator with XRE-family HTH domain
VHVRSLPERLVVNLQVTVAFGPTDQGRSGVGRESTGLRLRQLRRRLAKSQTQVAIAAGITQSALSNYETGKRELPLRTALALSAALNVTVGELLGASAQVMLRNSRVDAALAALARHPELLDFIDR